MASSPSDNEDMSAPAMLPGSRHDKFPLLVCVKCKLPRERSGGVMSGARFICRACFNTKSFKSVSAQQSQRENIAKLDRERRWKR